MHIAMFRDEFVVRRKWLTTGEFMDLLSAANLLPGPTRPRWRSASAESVPAVRGCSSPASLHPARGVVVLVSRSSTSVWGPSPLMGA